MFNTMRGWFGMLSKRGARPQVKSSAHIRINLEALEARLSPSVTPFNPLQTTKSGGNTVAILGKQPTLNVTTQAATDHIIVKFNQPTSFAASLGVMGEQLADKVFKVRLAPGADMTKTLATFKGMKGVAYAEPDYVVRLQKTPNDPAFSTLWGLNNPGGSSGKADADIDAPEAWDVSTGTGKTLVAVIDTGVDYRHPDLAANMWKNPGEIAGNGKDDDNNGIIDDIFGADFYSNDGDPMDEHGHGTHVSGTIGAVGNNGIGVSGVNWNAKIMALRFLGPDGSGEISDAIKCLDYAVKMGAKISNNSWGGGGFSQAFKDALTRAGAAGHTFVAAAGNHSGNNDKSPSYPASYDNANVVSVAAMTSMDELASFSCYGKASVDIAAPGVGINSTLPGGTYGSYSGTSMATPHVVGALSLVMDANPGMTGADAVKKLLSSVDSLTILKDKVATGGRLNVAKALVTPVQQIKAPSNLQFTNVTDTSVRLSWKDNSSNETMFKIMVSQDSGKTWTHGYSTGMNTPSYTVEKLNPGREYRFQIIACNDKACSLPSNTVVVTTASPKLPPNAPTNLEAFEVDTDSVQLEWQDNSKDETGFKIMVSTDGGASWKEGYSTAANTISYNVGNLKHSTEYQFRVIACNNSGCSLPSNTVVVTTSTLPQPPAAPSGLEATDVQINSISLSWEDNSEDETGFQVYMSSDGNNWNLVGETGTDETYLEVGELQGGTRYSFKVVAFNENGTSLESNLLNVTTQSPPTRPNAPYGLKAGNPTTNSVGLTWKDSSDNETSFQVYYRTNGSNWNLAGTTGADQTTFQVSGLKGNTPYQFKVVASNDVGDSDASNTAKATTEAVKPSEPTNLKASSVQRNSFKLTWNSPSGSLDRYEVWLKVDGKWKISEEVQGHRTAATIEFEERRGPRLKAGKTYQVKMRAIDKAGKVSDWSAEITVKMAK